MIWDLRGTSTNQALMAQEFSRLRSLRRLLIEQTFPTICSPRFLCCSRLPQHLVLRIWQRAGAGSLLLAAWSKERRQKLMGCGPRFVFTRAVEVHAALAGLVLWLGWVVLIQDENQRILGSTNQLPSSSREFPSSSGVSPPMSPVNLFESIKQEG